MSQKILLKHCIAHLCLSNHEQTFTGKTINWFNNLISEHTKKDVEVEELNEVTIKKLIKNYPNYFLAYRNMENNDYLLFVQSVVDKKSLIEMLDDEPEEEKEAIKHLLKTLNQNKHKRSL